MKLMLYLKMYFIFKGDCGVCWIDHIKTDMGENAALAQDKITILVIVPSIFSTKCGGSE